MCQEFGIKFKLGVQDKRDNISYWSVIPIDDSILHWPKLELDTEQFNIRYFISSDSEVMMNPQEGDLLKHRDGFVGLYDEQVSKLGLVRAYMGCSAMSDNMDRFEIIQRDSKAFFMPEIKND